MEFDPIAQRKMALAANVERLCGRNGVTMEELARRTGLSTSTLLAYLQERSFPNDGNLRSLATALGVDSAALCEHSDIAIEDLDRFRTQRKP